MREEGREQGRAEGRVENILIILGARGIDVTDATRERITTCRDSELSHRWLMRALVAATADEIFSEEPSADSSGTRSGGCDSGRWR
nr:hypothetical protein C5F59_09845 [Streptomyces sp. QL37]